jgi:hypothetical protein
MGTVATTLAGSAHKDEDSEDQDQDANGRAVSAADGAADGASERTAHAWDLINTVGCWI